MNASDGWAREAGIYGATGRRRSTTDVWELDADVSFEFADDVVASPGPGEGSHDKLEGEEVTSMPKLPVSCLCQRSTTIGGHPPVDMFGGEVRSGQIGVT